MQREVIYAVIWGLITSFILAILILIGSRNLAHFDAALVAYTASILFATFGLTYRYTMWLQRPPTALYWKRGWQVFLNPKYLGRNIINWFRHVTEDIALNRFIFERSRMRGLTHFLIMWGCIIAIGITFPLVFGWLHFESVPGEIDTYQAYVFGFPTFTFPSDSLFGFLIFHGLVWSAFITIAGVMLAMRPRMREEGAAALQLFVEDFLPL
ncbi:MAG: MFS transporter, partial [Anaerolineae bacterium]|nr:MFS transporter [Anaerolineae bacterium]